jgi:AraC-like DNA-binding protein
MMAPPLRPLKLADAPAPAGAGGMRFGGVQVWVHDECAAGGSARTPDGGYNHFWLDYQAPQNKKPVPAAADFNGAGPCRWLVFVPPGVCRTAAVPEAGKAGLLVRFEFEPAILEAAAVSLHVDPRTLYRAEAQEMALHEPLETLCRLLAWEAEEGCPHGLGFFEALSWALAVALVRRVAPVRPYDSRLERAIQLLEQRFRERVSVAEAARAAGLSRCHFLRAFRASVGVSPHEYLVQCRLRHARRLIALDGGRRSLAEIAWEAGFSDQAHLTRHFRRAFGQTPGQWQRAQ